MSSDEEDPKTFLETLFGTKQKMPPKKDDGSAGTSAALQVHSSPEEREFIRSQLVKRRTIRLRNLTMFANQFGTLLNSDVRERGQLERGRLSLLKLEDAYKELEDAQLQVEMVTEDDSEATFMEQHQSHLMRMQRDWARWSAPAPFRRDEDDMDRSEYSSNQFKSLMGLNFDVKKVMRIKFSGKTIREYPSFRVNWDSTAGKLDEMSYTPAQKLLELKKCLTDDALELIVQLPDEDEFYENAITILDEMYKDPIKAAESVITGLLAAPRMGNTLTVTDLRKTYNAINQADQTLKGLKVTDAQRGTLLFSVLSESKLNNTVLRLWMTKKGLKKNADSPIGHDATVTDLLQLLTAQIRSQQEIEDRQIHPEPKKEKEQGSGQAGGKKKETTPTTGGARSPIKVTEKRSLEMTDKQNLALCVRNLDMEYWSASNSRISSQEKRRENF